MSKIDAYFQSLERQLRDDFARRRAMVSDSEVKGHANERAVGGFIEKYLQPLKVVYNAQIIDSFGGNSDEIDISACNGDQPAPETELIIAEGVSFAIQVKAILDDHELDRIQQNADRVKRLYRRTTPSDIVYALPIDIPFYVDRVPYFVFAFESKLTLATALERAETKFNRGPPELRPDGIFIMDRGAILTARSALDSTANDGNRRLQALEFGNRTLMNFLQHLHMVSRVIRRSQSPLVHYFPRGIAYRGHEIQPAAAATGSGEFLGQWLFNDLVGAFQLLKKSAVEASPFGPDSFARLQVVEACARWEFPPTAFAYSDPSFRDTLPPIDDAIARELSEYIRRRSGIDEELSPYPRFGVPFKVTTPTLGKDVSVLLRTEFFNDIQRWLESTMPKMVTRPHHIAAGLSWPPAFGL